MAADAGRQAQSRTPAAPVCALAFCAKTQNNRVKIVTNMPRHNTFAAPQPSTNLEAPDAVRELL